MLKHPMAGDVRGQGLFAGGELAKDKDDGTPLEEPRVIAVCGEMAADGILVGRASRRFEGTSNVIYFAPAYVATKEDVARMVDGLSDAIPKALS